MKMLLLSTAALALLAAPALAASPAATPRIALTLKDHRFSPVEIAAPAGVKLRIDLVNEDGATEEFDSDDLRVEQMVTPHGRTSFTVGPLKPGAYDFMGELHADTAQGRIVVAPQS